MTDNVWTKLNTLLLLVIVILLSVMLGRQSRNQSGRFVEGSGGVFDTQTGQHCVSDDNFRGRDNEKETIESLRNVGLPPCSDLAKR
jgi:hypothetical protein